MTQFELSVYKLPQIKDPVALDKIKVQSDKNPVPKLIKYGFNNLMDYPELNTITKDDHYRAGLNFDLVRNDKESLKAKVSEYIESKQLDQTFFEMWEIMLSFDLFSAEHISSSHSKQLADVVKAFHLLSQSQSKSKSKQLIESYDKSGKTSSNLIFHKFSDAELTENVTVGLLIGTISKLMTMQSVGANLVIQIFSCQSQVMIEIIWFLTSYYTDAYIYKPCVTSDLFDCRYLILLGLKIEPNIKNIASKAQATTDNYISTFLDRSIDIPSEFTTVFQCMNSELIPKKFNSFLAISKYLDTKVYEGASYQELIQNQNSQVNQWINLFASNLSKLPPAFNKSLDRTNQLCNYVKKLDSMSLS
jgi:hypothetical protein